MHIKTVLVKNNKNVLVQIPGFIVNNWKLLNGDSVEVSISDDEKSLIIKPRKGFFPKYCRKAGNLIFGKW